MSRRRLRLECVSDEEDADKETQQQQHFVGDPWQEPHVENNEPPLLHPHSASNSSNPSSNPNVNSSHLEALDISDDDFIDVSDHFSPPIGTESVSSWQSQPPADSRPRSNVASGEVPDFPVDDFLRKMGLRLRKEWLDSCIRGLQLSVPTFGRIDVAARAKHCFEQFLYSDMNFSGCGCLPENVSNMHLVDLAGPFVLQVDEIVNISSPLSGRYQNVASGIKRCLKLSMTDGLQRVFGMEYRPIKYLDVLAPSGLKVAVCNVQIRHGLLMLVPEVIEVLGGVVEELDAARQRLVHEVNKPPRGKRTRTGMVPPLTARATQAAWPSYDATSGLVQTSALRSENTTSVQPDDSGPPVASATVTSEWTAEEHVLPERENVGPGSSLNAAPDADIQMVDELEHPVMLTGNKELPFSYLASLSAKWASVKEESQFIRGKIKCFLTGVKGFQYKQRSTFELMVYVDDGSLISEILIDHSVVEKGIGHSPQEVSAALSSSDTKLVRDMREKLKQFQFFLANFEGILFVEMSASSPLPVALEMNEGCTTNDACLLLRRQKSATSVRRLQHPCSNPIDISP